MTYTISARIRHKLHAIDNKSGGTSYLKGCGVPVHDLVSTCRDMFKKSGFFDLRTGKIQGDIKEKEGWHLMASTVLPGLYTKITNNEQRLPTRESLIKNLHDHIAKLRLELVRMECRVDKILEKEDHYV